MHSGLPKACEFGLNVIDPSEVIDRDEIGALQILHCGALALQGLQRPEHLTRT